MSTFLVSIGVVGATIVALLRAVLNGPDQPATIRRQRPDAKARRARKAEARAGREAAARARAVETAQMSQVTVAPSGPRPAMAMPAASGLALPDSDVMRLRVLPARRTTIWVRIRSFVALVVLVAVLGALLALAVGGAVFGIALLIRSATS